MQRQNFHSQIISPFTPATNLKIGTCFLKPNFVTQKWKSKKFLPIRKGSFQINDKPTYVTCKLFDSNKKVIVQHRNNLLPYYPKEDALRELTQLYSFTGLNAVHDNSHDNHQQNHNINCSTQSWDSKPKETKNIRLKPQEISNKPVYLKNKEKFKN